MVTLSELAIIHHSVRVQSIKPYLGLMLGIMAVFLREFFWKMGLNSRMNIKFSVQDKYMLFKGKMFFLSTGLRWEWGTSGSHWHFSHEQPSVLYIVNVQQILFKFSISE